MKGFMQKLGKSLMMPISIIAAAGIFLGLAAVLQNPNIVGESFVQIETVQQFLGFVRKLVGTLFGNLPILFAVSVAIGLAKDEKATAAFGAIIGFLLFHVTISYVLGIQGITPDSTSIDALKENGLNELEATTIASQYELVLGIFSFRMNVFGGIIVGMWTAFMHNRFYQIELPMAISFFGGKRFIPIIVTVTIPILALGMFFIWPFFNDAIVWVGGVIASSGAVGSFLFGSFERLLVPTGLHHILNQLVRFTPVGGVTDINGEQTVGALNIFNTLLAQGTFDWNVMQEATRFLAQGKIPFMVFGLPAATLAMYKAAKPSQKKHVKGLLYAAALASFTTGITEPIEFAFLFVSPLLFFFHAFMAGMSFFLMDILNVAIGNVQGGIIDLAVFGVLQGTSTNWIATIIVGAVYAISYYFVFKWVIERFDVKTPGREEDSNLSPDAYKETVASTTSDKGDAIVAALGGSENIKEVENCFTRLRLVLGSIDKIDEAAIKATGAAGIVKINENNLQVVYGPQVEKIALEVKRSWTK
ncbi:PTS transporter subunit EIIC [Mesobacillus stamsii]|uniref:PTS system D-glucosamine-specific IIC component/PTS system maltose and glucose-specific IIC component n=1 Tax=Mesobacillus stamsii TaxID=225347 RepID=A0ABU0FQV4_9BACI|nr:PTS transporter subunit EIIC [Mesobacillus stamsii]MDQ0412293.1 PTS system D-glucosamine-specific IIC component/PTS system maltose and glucose-specific IIC component [Mesobacillus stamsii]